MPRYSFFTDRGLTLVLYTSPARAEQIRSDLAADPEQFGRLCDAQTARRARQEAELRDYVVGMARDPAMTAEVLVRCRRGLSKRRAQALLEEVRR